MQFTTLYFTAFLSTLAVALPLEGSLKAHRIVPREKSYAIVNVDGGSSTPPPPQATTVVEDKTKTKTIKVTDTAPTVTDKVTATVTLTPAVTDSPVSAPKSSSSDLPKVTPTPSVVTVIITETSGPTEYYDNGLWHTSYAVKTFAAAVTTVSSDMALSIALPSP